MNVNITPELLCVNYHYIHSVAMSLIICTFMFIYFFSLFLRLAMYDIYIK